jgi:eukaryotic-like serine/threonine-protein kinase
VSERDIFTAAREMTDPVARSAYLDGACGGDTELRTRVEALLRAHDQPDSLLDRPAVASHGTGFESTVTVGDEGGAAADEVLLGFLAPATRPDSLGRIGHYEVLQVLGNGGFGIVFRAFDDVLHRVVAVKVLSPLMAATSPARKRFLREARSSAQVRHENVVQVYEVGEQPLPYISMEFIPGETLQQRLDRTGPIDVVEVVRIGRQIAEGLAAAHATDLIHRDIKPGNVMLEGGQLRVKITDFGLARAADDASISQSGIIAGTPMYMAPEQARGETLDQRADLFSLGSVLYVMASGRPPFRANNTVAVLKRVAEDTPRPIREIIPETPQWLCDIIAKLHAKDPAERFQSARDVADVLADCEAQLKANSRLKDFSRIPRRKSQPSGRWKWVAATILLLPVIALAATEIAGVTNLFRGRPAAHNPLKPGDEQTAIQLAKQESPPRAIALFDTVQAKKHQEAWAKHFGVPVEMTNSLGMKFELIPPGKFTMGSPKIEIDRCLDVLREAPTWVQDHIKREGPQHAVEITQPFYLGATEVTVRQYRQFIEANPNYNADDGRWRNPGCPQTDDHPVVTVSWQNAVDFCNWLSKTEGKEYRLPTEAEWEFGCRTGKSGTRYGFGDDDDQLAEYAWFNMNAPGGTQAVGGKKPNDWSLYDTHGNVWEWCQDRVGGMVDVHAFRGGGWKNEALKLRSACCPSIPDSEPSNQDIGFRVLLVSPSGSAPPLAVAPFTNADVQRIAALPAAEQVEEVRKELMKRNPGFDGKVEHKIEDGVVTEFKIVTDPVTDIAPIRVFNALRVLECRGQFTNKSSGLLSDLTPLLGMNLAELTHLNLRDTMVSDAGMVYFKDCTSLTTLILPDTHVGDAGLAHFKNCKALEVLDLGRTRVGNAGLDHFRDFKALTGLWLGTTNVDDAGLSRFRDCKSLTILDLSVTRVSDAGLAHFQDCKALTRLILADTKVSDAGLAHFKNMPLMLLWIHNSGITDLTPLQGMPLEDIRLTPKNITKGVDILRDMKSLRTIGVEWDKVWPAAEFWERYDKGEFKE